MEEGRMATAVSADTLEQREYNGEGRAYPPLELDGDVVPGVLRQAEPYVAPPSLRDAVNMALYLRRPLLLEGEPGTGKTRLAYSVAYESAIPSRKYTSAPLIAPKTCSGRLTRCADSTTSGVRRQWPARRSHS